MELTIAEKGNKYVVEDKKSRLLYTVKRKGFAQRYILLDASNYNLYTLIQEGDARKPIFSVILNDDLFLRMECKSLFLDPTITAEGKNMKFEIASKDRKNFEIILNDIKVGSIITKFGAAGTLQYDLEIVNTAFDDYIPLFAVAIDKAFGEMNRS
ncbi:MAG: hypothetical protein IJ010_00920 [Ruminococcus sp.]|nr:hypothetical protein [Ruminococcus sp.]